jgi:hypothetical protein
MDIDQPLKPPGAFGDDWNLFFPFKETFVPAFELASSINHINFKSTGRSGCYTFLKDVTEEEIGELQEWLSDIAPYVAIRDCLLVSFALDYDREDGNPLKSRTKIGCLRIRAKPYDNQPTDDTYVAADELTAECLGFATKVRCYDEVDAVVAVPPSKPDKEFDLPRHLARGIANGLGKDDLSDNVRTVKARASVKNRVLSEKLSALEDTIHVDPEAFKGKMVMVVDDLYQSGVSINYLGMLLLQAGARKVLGLACEKTCRNDDNVGGADSGD